MRRHLALGEAGEELAVRYLEERGLRIVERRVRYRFGELDIVARDGKEWVFVEVKTRSGTRMGTAREAFSARKSARMKKAVAEYMRLNGLDERPIRCDFLAIDLEADGTPSIAHYPGGISWT